MVISKQAFTVCLVTWWGGIYDYGGISGSIFGVYGVSGNVVPICFSDRLASMWGLASMVVSQVASLVFVVCLVAKCRYVSASV